MGTRTAKFVTSRLMSNADFAEWVKAVAGSGSQQDPVGVLGFEASERCQKVVDAINFRRAPTVVVMVSNFEPLDAQPGASVPGNLMSVTLRARADIAVGVLSYSETEADNHTELHSASTVADLFGIMEMYQGRPWSFDVDSVSLEQLTPLREFELTA